ncbi:MULTISPECIES: DUF4406 domain-containing protein [Pseudomonas]|jgi:hypothetical protein|uniref:DUF4406 domain-containing protein n=2 Tax=Pseudomonas TaxID=286 RepID=A0A9X4C302_9PSED|nr:MULTISPECIES: DUF4406 domain-containing protein [Pseudomonas]MDD1009340.1 DUF4406 domain-containing protein [Pseudomonas shahriarae]
MIIEPEIDCPALHHRAQGYPFGDRVPHTVRMVKTVTADPMPVIGFTYITGAVPTAVISQTFRAWTNSYGAVAAVMSDGQCLGLKPGEFEVCTWHDATPQKPIYLSGPMTGLVDLNFPAFHAMAARLRAAGHAVINPAEIDHPTKDWSDCLRRDIVALMECYTLATLSGWEHSKGARLEVIIAERLGMTVVSAHDLLSTEAV